MRREPKRVVAFLLLSQLLSVLFTLKLLSLNLIPEPYQPFGNRDVAQASANSLAFLSMVLVATFVFLIFLTKLKFLLKHFVSLVSVSAFFLLNSLYLPATLGLSNGIVLTTALTLLLGYALVKSITPVVVFSALLVSAEVGSYLSLALRPPTLVVFPAVFALYDAVSVFRGPLGKLIKLLRPRGRARGVAKPSPALGIFLVPLGGFSVGTGDLVFSSFFASAAAVVGGLPCLFLTLLATNAGFFLTLRLVEKYKRPLPALPLPTLFWLLVVAAFYSFR